MLVSTFNRVPCETNLVDVPLYSSVCTTERKREMERRVLCITHSPITKHFVSDVGLVGLSSNFFMRILHIMTS